MADGINTNALSNPMSALNGSGSRQADDILNQRSEPAAQATNAMQNNDASTTIERIASPEVVQQAVENRDSAESTIGGLVDTRA